MNKTPLISLKKERNAFESVQIKNSKDTEKFTRQFYSDDIGIYESFFILLLNRNHKTIGYSKISQGGICGTVVDVKIICKYVVDTLASNIILVHNHPSGVLRPSNEDLLITDKIKKALKIFDCKLLDHIILTEDSYYSFIDNQNL